MKNLIQLACIAVGFLASVGNASAQEAAASAASAATPVAVPAAPKKFVAGLQPDRRPEGFPVVTADPAIDQTKLDKYLKGIEQPLPGNVESIVKTGSWYVPMRKTGMTAPYDLRGLHK